MQPRKILFVLFTLITLTLHAQRWVGTWACAPQTVDKSFMPYNNQMTNRSVRQVVKVSIGGNVIRLRLSNEMSSEPVEITSVYNRQKHKKVQRYVKEQPVTCNSARNMG